MKSSSVARRPGGSLIRLAILLALGLTLPLAGAQSLTDILDPEPPQDDCETGADASDDQAAPTRLSGALDCVGIMTQRDTTDAFVFRAEAGQWVEVSLTPDGSHPSMSACVLGPEGSGDCFQVNDPDIREGFAMPVAGDVLVVVSWWGDQDIQFDYRFRATKSGETPDAPQDDCGLGHGASNWYATADVLEAPVDCHGTLAGEDAWDWYSFHALLGQQITVALDVPWWADHEICLYSPSGALAGCSTRPAGESELLQVTSDRRGMWWLVVYRYSADATHRLRIDVTGEPANEAPRASLDCPWSVEVLQPFQCVAHVDDFESENVRVEIRWNVEDAFEDAGTFVTGAVALTHAFSVEDEWVPVTLRVTDGEGLQAFSWAHVYVHPPAPAHDDCGTGGDAGDGPASASPLTAPVMWCVGRIYEEWSADLDDFYAVEIPPEGGHLRATIATNAPLNVCLIDPSGAQRGCHWESLDVVAEGGTWIVQVGSYGWDDENATYSLAITTRAFHASGEATLPGLGGTLPVALSDAPVGPDLDGYFVDLPFVASGVEAIRVDGNATSYDARFYDAEGNLIGDGGSFTGYTTPIPPGATRILVQRPIVLDVQDPELSLVAYW